MLLRAPARLVFIVLLFCSTICSAQQKWPSTLLWKITGNGLEKPSYLYGTMHMQDQRLFQFGDSLYRSLESVEGFALEVDFREFFDSIFHDQVRLQEERLMDKEVVKVDSKKIDRTSDSIMKQLGIEPDQMTRQDLKRIRDYKMNKIVQQGEMQTIVDGFLYGIALRQHKWMGGIEDVNDQIRLFDEMGRDVDPEEVFQPESNIRSSLEHMVKTYQAQDLNSIARMADVDMSDEWRDELLIKRNVKMARRMDSLSAIRTMFFAFGCAHLPGDSGVINLLRSRGFTVQPVFSSKKISAELYASRLSKIDWVDVADDDKLYTVQMPGVPSAYDMFGQAMKIKMFFDLPTMTVYMTGHTIGRFETSADAEAMLLNMIDRMGGVKHSLKKKFINKGDIKGIDGSFDYQGGAYRVELLQKNNTLFMLMVGCSKRTNLSGGDVEHYFSSFRDLETPTQEHALVSFTIPNKGFTIMLPGKPKPNHTIDGMAEKSMWKFHTYDLVDNEKGLYFLVQVKETKEAYVIQADSAYFDSYIKEMKNRLGSTSRMQITTYEGYPALYMEGLSTKEKVISKVFQVVRGNRVYSIVVAGQAGADFSQASAIFNTLRLTNYPAAEWKTFYGDGFYTTTPAPVHASESADEESPLQTHSSAYNEINAVSYQVYKQPLTYFWYRNDSSLFDMQMKNNTGFEDTVLSHRMTTNGSLKGLEIVVQSPNNNCLKKLRFLVNGDTLYTLMSFLPSQLINDPQEQKFFDDFRMVNEIQPTLYTSKARKLLEDLSSVDSMVAATAKMAIPGYPFSKSDLPLLHKALIKPYQDSSDFNYTRRQLIYKIVMLADSTTLNFISEHYDGVKYNYGIQYQLLDLLAMMKSTASYRLMKELMLNRLPINGLARSLRFEMFDSLELARSLYPEILRLLDDSLLQTVIPFVTNKLLDSNLLTHENIYPYKDKLIESARHSIQVILANPDMEEYEAVELMKLIAKFNNKGAIMALEECLHYNSIYIKENAAMLLVKKDQLVPETELEKIAADYYFRIDFYNDLKKLDLLKIFPSMYLNQKSLAESEIHRFGIGYNLNISKIDFISERVEVFMGKKQKFYLFKLGFGPEESKAYLGIAGPYSMNGKELETSSDATGIVEEEYDKDKVEVQFLKYLANMEDRLREEEKTLIKE